MQFHQERIQRKPDPCQGFSPLTGKLVMQSSGYGPPVPVASAFQSPGGEIGNAVSLGFRMEYRMRCAFFQT